MAVLSISQPRNEGRIHSNGVCISNKSLKALRMTSGDNESSYAVNSDRQASVFHNLIKDPLEHLLRRFAQQNTPTTLRIADLGCATGQNTLSFVDFIVKTLKGVYGDRRVEIPELQVYFNDVPSNDFNDLFSLLDKRPDPDQYFATGVPRSFYNLLFPKASMNVMFSTMSLHWLSRVPDILLKESSSMRNHGRAWINGGSPTVAAAYADQSRSDLRRFFEFRAKEMGSGGVLYICCMGRPDSYPCHKQVDPQGEYCGPEFDAAWNDLVREGLIGAEVLDLFNLPWYFPSAQEIRDAVEYTDAFEVEMIDTVTGVRCMEESDFLEWTRDYEEFGKRKGSLVRSFVGSLVEDAVGAELADVFFQRLEKRSSEFLAKGLICPSPFVTCTVASIVKK